MTDNHTQKPPDVLRHIDDLRYVVEVFARYSTTNPGKEVTVKRGPMGIFGKVTRNDTYVSIGGSHGRNAGGILDLSTVQEALAQVEALTDESKKWVSRMLHNPPKPGFIYDSGVKVELWVGTPGQFEPRPSDSTKLWSRNGELGARKLSGAEISQACLDAFIANFNTPEKDLRSSIAAATAPVRSVKPMQPLQLRPLDIRKGP